MRIRQIRSFSAVFVLLALLAACGKPSPDPAEEAQVRAVVEGFGSKLGLVSLLSPTAAGDIQTQYSPYVAPALLDQWAADPSHAPGRTVSSPWPDRIEIDSITKISASEYSVTGRVVEITSVEAANGGSAYEIRVQIRIQDIEGRWEITGYAEEQATP